MLTLPLKSKLKELDLYGVVLFLPSLVCLLLALQWGGTTYAWNSGRIIALFVVAGLCCIGFVAVEIKQGDRATIPPSMMARRTLWACTIFVFFLGGSFMVITYYIPIWFQAIKGTTAIQSGINNLPSILAAVVFSIVSGGLVTVLGYYTWACILSAILTTVVCACGVATSKSETEANIYRVSVSSQPSRFTLRVRSGSATRSSTVAALVLYAIPPPSEYSIITLISLSTAGSPAASCRHPDSTAASSSSRRLCSHHFHADSWRSSLRRSRADHLHEPISGQHSSSRPSCESVGRSSRRCDKHRDTR